MDRWSPRGFLSASTMTARLHVPTPDIQITKPTIIIWVIVILLAAGADLGSIIITIIELLIALGVVQAIIPTST